MKELPSRTWAWMIGAVITAVVVWLYGSLSAVEDPALRNGAFGAWTEMLLTVGAFAGITYYWAWTRNR